ncbi:MAG: 23S rRNA (guanosine(2251)-2'-O)-methyltransferase RlmB [Chloroflexi bacterium]|nr:23S rRNA (guanosine(2251)-2'-O)-methyltransferase RlmB [Chloroflexota bacterium]
MAHEIAPFLYGRWPVLEALRAGVPMRKIVLAEGVVRSKGSIAELCTQAEAQGVTVQVVPRTELDRAVAANHQGVIAEIAPYQYASLETLVGDLHTEADPPPLLLMLDCLQDIQNFGSLLRTAEAVGVDGVIIPKRRSASVTPALYKTSAGAVQYLKIARVSNLTRTMTFLKEGGFWIAGLDAEGETEYGRVNLRGPLAIVVGAESQGLSRLVREQCDLRVRLPLRGRVASLNAAVAGSVILYEVWRQRQGT